MKYYLFMGLMVIIGLLFFCVRKVKKTEGEMRKPFLFLICAGFFPAIFQATYLISCGSNQFVAYLMLGLYYASIDWLLIALLYFVEHYTHGFRGEKHIQVLVVLIASLETISFVVNTFTRHAFILVQTIHKGQQLVWTVRRETGFFIFHLVFTYLLVACSILALVNKMRKTPRFYRGKFRTMLYLIAIVVVFNGIGISRNSPFDWSIFLYCIIGLQICYYAVYYKPKGLIDRTLAMVVEDINEAVFCFDLWGKCVYINNRVKEYFNGSVENEVVESFFSEKGFQHPEEKPDESQFQMNVPSDNEIRTFDVTYRKLFDSKHEYIGCFFTLLDRTDEIRRFNEEHYRLTHDRLTGLYNREFFFEAVEKRLKENPEEQYCMVCSNIKGFKLFNDLFGEKRGDEVLVMEAELLRKYSGEFSVYGRISGDEFAVLVPKRLFEERKFIENINRMRDRFNSSQYKMHIYVGVYDIEDKSEPIFMMCDKARLAIESFKGDYSTIMVYYDRALMEQSLQEREIVGQFDHAIENEEFCMYLQPQINAEGKTMGAEALVRWQHPDRGLVYPGEFIGIFEKTGLIYRLDRYMWAKAAAKLKEWKDAGNDSMHLSVNISAMDFYYLDIYEELTGLVEKYGINPGNLKLEITETVLMKSTHMQGDLLERLRRFGFQIEIDDFGSGYSSLNMLKNIDVDIVKIDMGFLEESDKTGRANSILDSIIKLIKQLGMGVITEGVETEEQVNNLLQMGCHMFQGYYFAKPMSVEDFEAKHM